jgi:hypothetical protein
MIYNIALLGQDGEHLAMELLEAEDHSEAQRAGSLILEFCKDVAHSYEVRFNGAVCGHRRRGLFDLIPILEPRQTNVFDVIERLRHGFTAVALSRPLHKAAVRLRRRRMLSLQAELEAPSPSNKDLLKVDELAAD